MKRMTIVTILALTVGVACAAVPTTDDAAVARGVDLAQLKGWDIVVADDAIPSEKHAAKEFQQFFGQASGADLPIVTALDRPDRHVFIGSSKAMRSSNVAFSIDDFGEEDLRIIVRHGNIAIAGGRPRGTLYGLYTFLEDYLGVRFLTHDHTHVPPIGDSRVVGPVDRFYHPPLDYRIANYGENLLHPVFAARLRCNGLNRHDVGRYSEIPVPEDPKLGGWSSTININHSFYHQVRMEEYGAEHPEYFALLGPDYKGRKGLAGKRSTYWDSQPCLTNPDVLKIVIQAVREELKNRPGAKNVSVSQNDGHGYCTCEKCAAIDERQGTHMGSLLTFVNAVADEIVKTHPNVKIGTLAYVYTEKPPRTIKPRPNVQIQLCSVRARPTRPISDSACPQNESFRRNLAAWGRICKDIGIWNYNLNHHHYLIPNPNMRVVEPNIRFFVANNVRRVFMQSPSGISTEFSDLKNYVASRLLWNPKLSGRQLRDEFLRLHYGPSAAPIRYYLELLHNKAEAVTKSYMHFAGRTDNFGIDDEVIRTGLKAFEDALELVDDDEVLRARVEKASIAVHCAAASQAMYWYSDRPGSEPKEKIPPELAKWTRPSARRLFELCEKYGVNWWGEGGEVNKIPAKIAYFKRIYGLKPDEPL